MLIFWSSIAQPDGLRARLRRSLLYLDRTRHGAAQLVVAMVSGVNKQLGLLQQLNSAIGVQLSVAYKLLRLEQVLGKFSAGVFVPEQLCVIKTAGEFGEDLVFVFRDIGVLRFDHPLRRAHHGGIRRFDRVLWTAA